MDKINRYACIPKIDRLMEAENVKPLIEKYGYTPTLWAAREVEDRIRREIDMDSVDGVMDLIFSIPEKMEALLRHKGQEEMCRVINATGVVLHTNLGRAPISKKVMERVSNMMTGFTNLEYRLCEGSRGSRYEHFEEMLCRLTGAEAAIAVNNNAAAVLLMLTALTAGREVIVSRGELVEIGGKFRVPEVMEQSGARLVEVGTTNRTYPEDYEKAIGEATGAVLKVHTSNYKIIGFTHEASVWELSKITRESGIPLLVDLGSGNLVDFRDYGIPWEITVRDIIRKGADLVTFSGDKLLGGPQAGILAGKKELIDKISRHPLMRAVRIDKFTAAAMGETLRLYLYGKAWEEIPVLEMLARDERMMTDMADRLMEAVTITEEEGISLKKVRSNTMVGGGSMPEETLPGIAVAVTSEKLSPDEICKILRESEPPVVGRIVNESVYLEMRTVFPEEIPVLAEIISELL